MFKKVLIKLITPTYSNKYTILFPTRAFPLENIATFDSKTYTQYNTCNIFALIIEEKMITSALILPVL